VDFASQTAELAGCAPGRLWPQDDSCKFASRGSFLDQGGIGNGDHSEAVS